MRVLHVIPSIAAVHGGPSCALQLMERGLSAAGVDVTTVTTDDDGSGRRLQAIARATEMHGAKRLYFRKWFDFYTVCAVHSCPGSFGTCKGSTLCIFTHSFPLPAWRQR